MKSSSGATVSHDLDLTLTDEQAALWLAVLCWADEHEQARLHNDADAVEMRLHNLPWDSDTDTCEDV